MTIDSRVKLALAVFLMAIALFAVAGVLAYKYVKVADYVCYYGTSAPGSYEAIVGGGVTGAPVNGSFFGAGGWSNPDDMKCRRMPSEEFVCPAKYSGGQEFLGYQYVTHSDIATFINA